MIDEHAGRRVRMGNLAFVGSHKINGVSALHTDLMRKTVFHALNAVYPGRITNKTNGITFRRWLIECNPGLADIIRSVLGERALDDYRRAEGPRRARGRSGRCRSRWRRRTGAARSRSRALIADQLNQRVDLDAMFDVQVKRIHEYKRQLLNILETVARYNAIRANPTIDFAPRVKIFAGKAAASYTQAKLIIKLAIDVAKVVNSDPTVRGLLKVVFLPNYNVSLAEIDHARRRPLRADFDRRHGSLRHRQHEDGAQRRADRSARSTAPTSRCAIWSATTTSSSSASPRPRSRRRAPRASIRPNASPPPRSCAKRSTKSARACSRPTTPARYRGLVDTLTHHDYFMVCADFDAYWATQIKIDEAWRDRRRWMRSSILNTANVGWFSSDRTIAEYAKEIWNAPFAPIG